MDYGRPALADRLAAEYVAGMLRGAARRRFESLLPAHPLLRTAVRDWQDRLMPLTAAVAPVQPSASVWKRIEALIHGGATAASGAATERWWQRLTFWRGLSAVAGIAAIALAVSLASPGPVQPPIIVVLAPAPAATASGTSSSNVAPTAFVASISADGRAMVTKPIVNVALAADRSLELWSVPAQGAPRSLGVIAPDRASVVARGKALEGTAAFAVTLEPAGGSPSGAPTGPVLYSGKLTL